MNKEFKHFENGVDRILDKSNTNMTASKRMQTTYDIEQYMPEDTLVEGLEYKPKSSLLAQPTVPKKAIQ